MSKIDSVKIRMYRHGFGDCFLVRFYKGSTVAFKLLIDCGLKKNDNVPGVSISDVVEDIKKEILVTKGKKQVPHLDALVATHEHWDHVSGFKPEQKLFDDFDIDYVWLAWTEDPKDAVAQKINKYLAQSVAALAVSAKKLSTATKKKKNAGLYASSFQGKQLLAARENFDAAVEDMLGFYGPFSAAGNATNGISVKKKYAISIETQKALDHIKYKLAKGKSAIRYFNPGDLIEKDTLPGIRIYVLGPPKDKQLNKDKPSAGAKKEVYMGLNDASLHGFVKGVLKHSGMGQQFDNGDPFINAGIVREQDAGKHPVFRHTYYNKNEAWRTIDEDWLDQAGALALQMDSDTNNTSLVLAIELVASGKILLFPGDAQVGNWLSWHDHTWNVKEGSKTRNVTATDILNRTVFYKTGHHASHNATLKEQGLELMNNEELVVFIPEKNDQYNGIPYSPLIKRLNEKACGRVFFSADKNFPPEKVLKTKPDSITKKDWEAFKKNIDIQKLFIEYTVK